MDKARWVYIWIDGIYSGLRAEQVKLYAFIIGVNERGEKHFLVIENGVLESTQSWHEVLLELGSRGMNSLALVISDGAMGSGPPWRGPTRETRQQCCWMHKTGHVLNTLPKSLQPKAKQALHDIRQADTRDNAEKALELFVNMIFPLSTGKGLQDDNPIESTFATIRHRTKRPKGCLSAAYAVQAQPMC